MSCCREKPPSCVFKSLKAQLKKLHTRLVGSHAAAFKKCKAPLGINTFCHITHLTVCHQSSADQPSCLSQKVNKANHTAIDHLFPVTLLSLSLQGDFTLQTRQPILRFVTKPSFIAQTLSQHSHVATCFSSFAAPGWSDKQTHAAETALSGYN